MTKEREIIFHGQHFKDFYLNVNASVKEKIGYVFRVIKSVEKVSEKFLKRIEGTDGLYEIRIEMGRNMYRIFCCFDKGNLVVLFNAFQKKTQKTQRQEIELAEKFKNEYFSRKLSGLKNKQNEKERSNKKR